MFDSIPMLSALREEDREVLEPLCRVREFAKAETIFREGDVADRIHFVVSGRVKIVKAAGPRDVIIELLGAGEPIGAVAVFERRAFPASAIPIEPSSILSIPEREFFALLEKRPEMMRLVLAGLTHRLMMVNKRMADMTGSAESRAARLFLTLADGAAPRARGRHSHPNGAHPARDRGPDRHRAGNRHPPHVALAKAGRGDDGEGWLCFSGCERAAADDRGVKCASVTASV